MRLVILFLVLTGALLGASPAGASRGLYQQWDFELLPIYQSWCRLYGKECANSNSIADARFEIFKDNYRFITEHNRGNHSYTLGLNEFSDMTHGEFLHRFLGGLAEPQERRLFEIEDESLPSLESLPSHVDWRQQGAVTKPKNQGLCGGCWAFSTTGAIEGINKIVTGELVSLSEQELIDCDKGDNGCNGGLMQNAFEYVVENGGLHTEEDYPYNAEDNVCNRNNLGSRVIVSIDGYRMIPEGDEKALLQAVAKQPVSVAIEAGGRPFQHYASGVFTGPCGVQVNHGVLVVGYGNEDGHDYWIVKNSWGGTWGDSGFIKMKRNTGEAGGLCSINTMASFPIKKGGDSPPKPTPTPSPPSPPSPPPSPAPEQVCDKHHKCPAGTTCCCRLPIGPVCLAWGCCNVKSAVCCSDHKHCCPQEYPVCSPGDGLCLKKSGDATGVKISRNVSPLLMEPDDLAEPLISSS